MYKVDEENFNFPNKVIQLPGFEQDGRVYSAIHISPTTDTKTERTKIIENHLQNRIRRLTPLECWRLQGFSDEAFYKAKELSVINETTSILIRKKKLDMPKVIKGMSDTQLYKQAGNSMTTKVIKAILKNILNSIEW